MLKLLATDLLTSSYNLGLSAESFVASANEADKLGFARIAGNASKAVGAFKAVIAIKKAATDLGLVATLAQAERCEAFAENFEWESPERFSLLVGHSRHLGYGLMQLSQVFSDEMQARSVFAMPAKHAPFYSDGPLFGEAVDEAFPSSVPEIAEAGKCRALGRWTACVMHLMRALEPALMALQTAVQVDVPKEQWDQIINQVEVKIREINKRSHGRNAEQWYSEAASHFRIVKNAWRNHAQHLHERYDEERATAIYDSVRAFMRHLAERLSEQ